MQKDIVFVKTNKYWTDKHGPFYVDSWIITFVNNFGLCSFPNRSVYLLNKL